jgi:hypothetical protein
MPGKWCEDMDTWVITPDIEASMRLLESLDPRFEYLGILLQNFDDSRTAGSSSGGATEARREEDEECNSLIYSQLDVCSRGAGGVPTDEWVWQRCVSGKRRLGLVFNTDTYEGPGLHWTAVFVGIDPEHPVFGVYYFDSLGRQAPARLRQFLQQVHKACLHRRPIRDGTAPNTTTTTSSLSSNSSGKQRRGGGGQRRIFEFKENGRCIQKHNSQCGIYVLLFLFACCTSGCTFQEICRGMPQDRKVSKLRTVFFDATSCGKQKQPSSSSQKTYRGTA